MNWKEQYKDRITTAADAVGVIKDSDYIVCSHAAANPQVIMRELVAQKERFSKSLLHCLIHCYLC